MASAGSLSTPRASAPSSQPQAATSAAQSSEFLTTEEAGAFLRLSPRTLEKQRVLGGGPHFRKFGTRVVYALEDLHAWANRRTYGMTSDPGCHQRDSVR